MKATNQPHWFDVGDEWYNEAYDGLDIEDVPCPGPSDEQYVPITWLPHLATNSNIKQHGHRGNVESEDGA